MSQNLEEMSQDYIFPTGKAAPTNVFPIDLKETPLRSVSTNLVEHDNNNVVSNMDFNGTTEQSEKSKPANKNEQIKSFIFGNRKKLIIFSSILFVVAFVAIIAVIMIVLATASKRI